MPWATRDHRRKVAPSLQRAPCVNKTYSKKWCVVTAIHRNNAVNHSWAGDHQRYSGWLLLGSMTSQVPRHYDNCAASAAPTFRRPSLVHGWLATTCARAHRAPAREAWHWLSCLKSPSKSWWWVMVGDVMLSDGWLLADDERPVYWFPMIMILLLMLAMYCNAWFLSGRLSWIVAENCPLLLWFPKNSVQTRSWCSTLTLIYRHGKLAARAGGFLWQEAPHHHFDVAHSQQETKQLRSWPFWAIPEPPPHAK